MRILLGFSLVMMSGIALQIGCQKEGTGSVVERTPTRPRDERPMSSVPREQANRQKKAQTSEPVEGVEDSPLMAIIETTKGDMLVELYKEEAPKTVANFVKLVKSGYYDDLPWHRVVPGFVIQTGQGEPQPTIPDEVNKHQHRPGALAMAKLGSRSDPNRLSEPDSASTQFYITLCSAEKAAYLNAEYTVFGQVREGLDVAKQITQDDKVKTIRLRVDEE
ncbi:MAG: peptidylprolyl isomerase [Candidatus Zipacnadales bacterium]